MASALVREVINELESLSDPVVAANRTRFFKAGKGEYGEGDVFRGLTVPQVRSVEKAFRKQVSLSDAVELLHSSYHEDRLLALLLMNALYARGDQAARNDVYNVYLANTEHVNNWDLVDSSARFIVGPHVEHGDRAILYDLAVSESLWDRRIAVIATYYLIKKGDFRDILKLGEMLLDDDEDLIHKAVGWMLREAGKMNKEVLIGFLDQHAPDMPRTMLRYSLEKLSTEEKAHYMQR